MDRYRLCIVAAALSAQAGCVAPHPEYDARAGDAVIAARSTQTLNPGGTNVDVVPGIDGRAGKELIDRYFDSFRAPPATSNVINIGGTLTDSSNNNNTR